MTPALALPNASARHLALLGAFPFPYPQGSQIFARDQALALETFGTRPEFFSYGRGQGEIPRDLPVHTAAHWASPRKMRSGPHWQKPLADLALGLAFRKRASEAQAQGDAFECVLAHNAEAAAIALALRPITRVPVVYVVHTILRHELSAYMPDAIESATNRVGQFIDRSIAARCDGLIVLGEDAAHELDPHTQAPIAVIPPGHFIQTDPTALQISDVCCRHGLAPGQYALYSGNLDRYQDLSLLEETARASSSSQPPIIIASHDPQAASLGPNWPDRSVRSLFVESFDEMRALIHGAETLILPRRRPGGFPIKLLNYMEAARPIIAFDEIAHTLVDHQSARLLPRRATGADMARALSEIHDQPELQGQLGKGARQSLESEHDWNLIGQRTLEHVERILGASSPSRRKDGDSHSG